MGKLRLLHLEDSPSDAFFVRNALADGGIPVEIMHAASRQEFLHQLNAGGMDAILVDSGLPDISGREAIQMARQQNPAVPVIIVSNSATPEQVSATLAAGASDYVLKGHWWQLICALRRLPASTARENKNIGGAPDSLRRLAAVVQELSQTRDLPAIMAITRRAARELTGADGVTFVLREGNFCHYADEDAIEPLWRGQRFPLEECVSGWVMTNHQPFVSADALNDPRVPRHIYSRTFVKSMVIVPIRSDAPVGAIGAYWASRHEPARDEVEILQALANTTAVAMENVQVYNEFERRVRSRTNQLEAANHELEAFSYSVAHDLRGPLHAVGGYTDLLVMKLERALDAESRIFLTEIHGAVERMTVLIDDLLKLAKIGRAELAPEDLDLSKMAEELFDRIAMRDATRKVQVKIQPGLRARADEGLMRIVLENLLSNAWKYTARMDVAVIEFGGSPARDGQLVFFVRDNGAGFDPQLADKLFAPFQRLHRQDEFEGTGVGLATVQRILHRHGGHAWAEGQVNRGATFYFSLPASGSE